MPISERDQAIFDQLTRQLAPKRGPGRARLGATGRGWRPPLMTTVAGLASLPAAATTGAWWIGVAGFLVAVVASIRTIERLPRPDRRWLRDHKLLPSRAYVDRRSYDGTIVARRTYILPPRLIAVAIVLVVVPMILATVVARPEATPSAGARPVQSELIGSRPGWG